MAGSKCQVMTYCLGRVPGGLEFGGPACWLQSWAGYLGRVLAFLWDGARGGIPISFFQELFASVGGVFILVGGWALDYDSMVF